MAKKENRFSLLVMPNKNDSELYFWFDGNPFGLHAKRSAIVLDGAMYPTEPIASETLELVRKMANVSPAVGYIVAKQDFMLVGVGDRQWHPVANELLKFFPGDKSAMHRVRDDRYKIAKTESLPKRMNLVRGKEGEFATKGLPEIRLQIPISDIIETKTVPETEVVAA